MSKRCRFHPTAIKRGGRSAPMKRLMKADLIKGRALDFGCGRGEDTEGTCIERYDPASFPVKPKGKFDTITCTYVLNILWFPWERLQVLQKIRELLAPGGRAYITVRRDVKRWQRTKYGYQVEVHLDEVEGVSVKSLWKTCRYETYMLTEPGLV